MTDIALPEPIPLHQIAREAEARYIQQILPLFKGNKKKTAEFLKIDRKTLYNKLKYAKPTKVEV